MYTYYTTGVCSEKMIIELEGDIIKNVEIIGGCDGNLKGIMSLVKGMDVNEAIKRMQGIECKTKGTSCPDQLSIALEECLAEMSK